MAACSQFLICVFISVSHAKTTLIAAKNTHFWFFGKVYFKVFIQHVTDIWHNLKSARVCYTTTFPSRERGLSGDFCPCIERRCSHGLKNRHEKKLTVTFQPQVCCVEIWNWNFWQFHAFALNVAFRVDRTVCSSSAAVLAFSIKRLFVKHKTYLFNKSYLKGGLKCLWKDKTFLLSSEISSGNLFFPSNICLYSQVFKKSESRQSFSGKLSKVNKPR